jgi:hypothetical protein
MDSSVPTEAPQGDAPTTWHLCWQAAVGREFFVDPSLYGRIRERLIDAHRRPGRVLIDYTLAPTEIHVVSAIPPGDGPGGVARAVGNVVARWVREAQPLRSPVLAGPYRAHLIGSVAELRGEVRMLAWRPVMLGLCATPTHHANGALRIALGLTPAQGFDARTLLRSFGDSVPVARAALRAWLAQRPLEREWRLWELTHGLVLAQGKVGPKPNMAREVRGMAAAALVAAAGADGIDGALSLLAMWVTAKLDAQGALDIHKASDAMGVRGRALVACLAVEHGLCSAASVARYFRRAKATISEQMTACKAREADQRIIATPAHRIVEEATALASIAKQPSRG